MCVKTPFPPPHYLAVVPYILEEDLTLKQKKYCNNIALECYVFNIAYRRASEIVHLTVTSIMATMSFVSVFGTTITFFSCLSSSLGRSYIDKTTLIFICFQGQIRKSHFMTIIIIFHYLDLAAKLPESHSCHPRMYLNYHWWQHFA